MPPIPTIQRPGGSGRGGGAGRGRGGGPGAAGAAAARGGGGAKSRSRGANDERRSELVCRVKYNNSLPDIPFDPKFILYPFEQSRFIEYAPTSLERQYKYELLTENDLGVHVDLILPEIYEKPEDIYDDHGKKLDPPLDPSDERLLEDDYSDKTDAKRSQRHATFLSWMRRPDYISTEQTRYQPTTIEKIESKVGFAVRKKMGDEPNSLYMDRDAQVVAIEKTFEDSRLPITEHYSKKGVTPVEVLEVLPDHNMWKYPCAQVIFDSDPAPNADSAAAANAPEQNEKMAQAMIRGVMDESGEQFVAYFLPTQETMEKRAEDFTQEREYDEDGDYEYKMFREYNWNVKSKASKGYEENFFFVVREDGIYYNELETRVRLSKRRLKAGQQPSNSKLVVKHRPLNKQEHKMQRYRDRCLEPPGEEEEMSEEDEEEEEEQIKDTQGDEDEDEEKRRSRSRSRSASSRSRSRSRSAASSRSRSSSRSKSRSPARSRSGSAQSRSGSPQSRGGSPRSRGSGSPRSQSRSRSRSKSRSRSRSRSGTPRSRSGSPRSRRSGSPKSRSGSPRSRSSRSRSRSRSGSRSGSHSPAGSRSGSDSD